MVFFLGTMLGIKKGIEKMIDVRIDEGHVLELETLAREIRLKTIETIWKIGNERKGHPGPALSIADIVTALYFDVMNVDPSNPSWEERDRFILSKGHSCPVVYVALAKRGFFSEEWLDTVRHIDSRLQGHPDMRKTPGIDMTTGSLGHGLSAGVGMAIVGKLIDKRYYYVYVILGDGELQEGLVWEAAMAASKYRLNNLIAFVDCNGWQSCGPVAEIMPLEPLSQKWEAFGWNVLHIDGHSMRQILGAIYAAKERMDKPTVILAKTTKGKGVSFMENDNSWHQRAPNDAQMELARRELRGA